MNPFLSIITINYNNARGLQKTIDSVLEQVFDDFEFIVIDGDSTDESKAVLEKHKESISYIVSEKDSGIYNAMNKGITVSMGDYLLFLNSGDALTSSLAIKEFVDHKDFCGDIIYGDYKFDNGKKIFPDKLSPFFFIKTSLPHQSTFFKKWVFEELGLYNEDYQITSDREFFIKCFLSGVCLFQHIEYPLTLFKLDGISNRSDLTEKRLKENHEVFKKYYGIFYQDYIKFKELEHENNRLKRKNLKGYSKKAWHKIKKIWKIR